MADINVAICDRTIIVGKDAVDALMLSYTEALSLHNQLDIALKSMHPKTLKQSLYPDVGDV